MSLDNLSRMIGPCKARPPASLKISAVPFAALPHDIAADPRLDAVDVRLLLALLYFARADPSCWPSDRSLGDRIGKSRATVQRHLRALERVGYIARDKTADNPTGRVIRLTWRVRETSPVSSATLPPVSPASCDLENGEIRRTRAGAVGTPPATGRQEKPLAAAELPGLYDGWLSRPPGDPLRELATRRIALRR